MSTDDRQKLEVAQKIRAVDPCAFFNEDTISAHGVIATLGPDSTVGDCEISFWQSEQRLLSSKITVDLDGPGLAPSSEDTSKQIAGETVAVDTHRDSNGNCAYKVPLRFPAQDSGSSGNPGATGAAPLAYASVSSWSVEPAALGCELVEAAVTNMVTAFRENRIPRRDNALLDVPLARRSPCELLQHLPLGYEFQRIDAKTDPYSCTSFLVSPDTKGFSRALSVEFDVAQHDRAMTPNSDWKAAQVNGRAALVSRDSGKEPTCTVIFPVGPVVDGYRPGAPEVSQILGRKQVLVQVMARCEFTDDLVPVAMDLFGANG
ncbi:hypothetical protein [Nocardia sp. NPDC049526]|uniref:hypothetical protein n=1 Tax=Nocardia sp. NPDC049526 TaxID=3364316 RepID=UPI0037B4D110